MRYVYLLVEITKCTVIRRRENLASRSDVHAFGDHNNETHRHIHGIHKELQEKKGRMLLGDRWNQLNW